MTELGLCVITVKKYNPHSNKKVAEGLEKVLKRDFITTSINENYIYSYYQRWLVLFSFSSWFTFKKIIGYAFGKRMTNDLVIKA